MSLVALDGTPLVVVGGVSRAGQQFLSAGTNTLMDAANEAAIMVGQIFTEDGASHTIDTTGSSSLGWRSGSSTFANAGTTVKIGLAAVDTATGPPTRAANVANVITFDVSKSLTGGGGGLTSNGWNEQVPDTGTKTIANGDLVAFCVQMTARGGADSVQAQSMATIDGVATVMPSVTSYTGAAYATAARVPCAVITFSDGVRGYFWGGQVFSVGTNTQTWNNGSATKEYGNYFLMPVPAKIYGLIANCDIAGDTDFVLYSDPLGTPVAEKTASVDLNTIGGSGTNRYLVTLFSSPYSSTASQPLAGIIKPSSATNVGALYKTFNASAHQKSESLGTNCYAINRASGAFAAQNSSKDRFAVGLIVGAFDAGGSSGPSGKLISVARGSPY